MQRILQEIMKKILLGTSDAWSPIHLSPRPSNPAYYIVNWRIFIQSANIQADDKTWFSLIIIMLAHSNFHFQEQSFLGYCQFKKLEELIEVTDPITLIILSNGLSTIWLREFAPWSAKELYNPK